MILIFTKSSGDDETPVRRGCGRVADVPTDPTFVDVFVEPNDNAPEGSGLRFRAEGVARLVSRVRYDDRDCAIVGWSSVDGGSPCAAYAIVVEDSGSGTALLVYGGDWGVRLTPDDGGEPFGEPYLLLASDAPAT